MFDLFRRERGFYRRLLALAMPILLQNLITNSLGLVDTFMVGTMGQRPLAGVTLANIPVFVVQLMLSLIHISEPTRPSEISYAVFCLKKIFLMIRRPPRSTL